MSHSLQQCFLQLTNRKFIFIKVPIQAAKLYALDHAVEVNLSTHRQRYKATFPAEQPPPAYQKLVFCFYGIYQDSRGSEVTLIL